MKKNTKIKIRCFEVLFMLRVMKIYVILLILGISTISANQTYSQTTRLSLNYNNVSMGKLFSEIEKQSEYIFIYQDNTLLPTSVTINAKDKTIDQILNELLPPDKYSYKINNRQVIIKSKANLPETVQQQPRYAQASGFIKDAETGETLIGVTIHVKGANIGTITNPDGSFILNRLPIPEQTLEISYVGYKKQSIKLSDLKEGEMRKVDIMMVPGIKLDDVVVTALGLKREEKALGYSVSKLDNEDFTNTVSSNWLNGLSGKVAGLNFDASSAGPGSSIRVTLRGEGSLSHDKNTALFVIDGVPIGSDMVASNSEGGYSNTDAPIDYGNGASDLNPDDIESVSVLKGPAATALYGSRAANGAIIITTKAGRTTKGLGVSINSSVTIEKASFWPDFQNEYGAGDFRRQTTGPQEVTPGEFSFWTVGDTPRRYSRYAFGAKLDGSPRYLYASKNWETNEFEKLPFVPQDWYKGFFDTGVTYTNHMAIDGNNGKGTSIRFTVKDTRNDWIVPNTGFNTQNIHLAATQRLNPNMKLNAKVTYYRKNSDNLPMAGYNTSSPLYTLIWSPTSVSVDDYYNEYISGRINKIYSEGGKTNQLINATSDNIYFQAYEQLNTMSRDRVYGNASLDINFIPNKLDLTLRSGMDLNSEFRTQRKPFYSAGSMSGMYKEQSVYGFEMNNDFLLSYKDRFNDFDLNASFGGNNMYYKSRNVQMKASKLLEPDLYNIRNSDGQLFTSSDLRRKSINSFYGFVSTSWKGMVFLEVTGRNDWSSTLAPGNNSYFYPSVNTSILLSEMFNMQKLPWIDLLKVRASWANVGNDTDPYQLMQVYDNSSNFMGSYKMSGKILNYDLKPENIESWEFGLEARLFDDHLGLDFTYYDSKTTDQIINVPSDYATGASSRVINAGKVTNKGIEIAARINPVKTKDFKWTINLNWSKNWNKLVELAPGVELWQLNSRNTIGSRVFVYAYPGTELGRIYGAGYERAPEGSFYKDANGNKIDCSGQVIVDKATGNPVLGTERLDHGSIYPDWKAGMNQTVTYKNVSLSMSFSAQLGGKAYSVTNFALSYMGKLKNTLEGRYDGLIHEGVNLNNDGTYVPNKTITTDIVDYYNVYVWNRNNVEQNTFSTSYLKMKECRISYRLPKKLLKKLKVVQGLDFAVYATNLFCITKWPQYDPEVASFSGSSLNKGVEVGGFPMTRTYGANLKLSF